jgi:hypothetical protein
MSKCPGQAGTFAKMRTAMRHHVMQERGVIEEQRLDETEVGEGTTVTFIDAKQPNASYLQASVAGLAAYLGLNRGALGLVGWDVYEAILTPGDLILITIWMVTADAEAFAKSVKLPDGARLRHVRVVRDYGMFDRREAPQYYPAAERRRESSA